MLCDVKVIYVSYVNKLYFLGKSVCAHVLTETNLFICRFLFDLSAFFSLHGYFMLRYKEKLEPSDRACYGKYLRGHRSAWFPLFISACRFVESVTICHFLVHCFGPFLAQNMFLSLQVFICFWETKYNVYCERVPYLHSKLLRRARLWLELLTNTVGRFLSRVFFGDAVALLRESYSF